MVLDTFLPLLYIQKPGKVCGKWGKYETDTLASFVEN